MRAIIKQTTWLFLAQALGRVIGLFYTIFLARNLGVSDFGLFTTALTYFSLVSSVADFGFNRFLIREVAKDQYKSSLLLLSISLLRLTVTAILLAILAIVLYLFDPDKMRVSLTLLAVSAVLPLALAQTLDAIFVAFRKLQYSAFALVTLNVSTVFLGIVLINLGFGTMGAVVALILGQLIYLTVLWLLLTRQKIKLLSTVKAAVLKEVTLGSLPYGLLGMLGLIYFRVDTLLLSYLRGNFEVGIYGAAYKFLEAVVFIPTVLSTALFPVLSKLHEQSPKQISSLYFKSMKIMLLLSLGMVLGYLTILPIFVRVLLPNYQSSVEVIKILSLAIPFMFLHVPASSVVLSTEKYLGKIILLSLIPLIFNVLMNLKFIPIYGFLAAAWITVASDVLSLLLILIFIQKYILKNA